MMTQKFWLLDVFVEVLEVERRLLLLVSGILLWQCALFAEHILAGHDFHIYIVNELFVTHELLPIVFKAVPIVVPVPPHFSLIRLVL